MKLTRAIGPLLAVLAGASVAPSAYAGDPAALITQSASTGMPSLQPSCTSSSTCSATPTRLPGTQDVGATPCVGMCASIQAFLPQVLLLAPSSSPIDIETSIPDAAEGRIFGEWDNKTIQAGGALATFIQGRYGLASAQMERAFRNAGGMTSSLMLSTPVRIGALSIARNGAYVANPTALRNAIDALAASEHGADVANPAVFQANIGVSYETTAGTVTAGNDRLLTLQIPTKFDSFSTLPLMGSATNTIPLGSTSRGLFYTPAMFATPGSQPCNSNGTTGNGTDDTAALQAAIHAAEATGGTLKIPGSPTMCRATAPLTVSTHMTLDGDYCSPYSNLGLLSPVPGPGSWLFFDHAGAGLFVSGADYAAGVVFKNFCTKRPQPAFVSSGTWTPMAADFDISIGGDDSRIEHVMLLNPTAGLFVQGRFFIDDVRMDAFNIGIQSTSSQDVARIYNVHIWPFSGINSAAEVYKLNHLEALNLGRIDNPDISNFFAISAKICLHLTNATLGVASKIHADNFDCDLYGNTAILSEAPGATGQFSNFTAQGADPQPGSKTTAAASALDINTNNNHFSFDGFRSDITGGAAIYATGAGNWLDFTGLFVNNWANNGTNLTPAIDAENGSTINLPADALFGPGSVSSTLYSNGSSGTINRATSTKVN